MDLWLKMVGTSAEPIKDGGEISATRCIDL
jgi:hypothetical protein